MDDFEDEIRSDLGSDIHTLAKKVQEEILAAYEFFDILEKLNKFVYELGKRDREFSQPLFDQLLHAGTGLGPTLHRIEEKLAKIMQLCDEVAIE